jgi:Holliday junction DNA helicase RuvA
VLRQVEGTAELTIETCLIVREDALQLYGFADRDECELFEQLLSVSGVGPKLALAILSASSPAELRRAIALEDTERFQAIPGVGRKTAQRVVLELKEKLAAGLPESVPTEAGGSSPHLVARAALVGLGYTIVEAEKALTAVDPELPTEERIRQALKAA